MLNLLRMMVDNDYDKVLLNKNTYSDSVKYSL